MQTPEAEHNQKADELLLRYLRTGIAEQSESVLSELITSYVTPLIREIVRYKLHTRIEMDTARGIDALEVSSSILVKVLSKLREWKLCPADAQQSHFLDYVAVAAYHTCNQYWRDSHPLRNRLKNRLLYLLTSRSDLAVWKKDAVWICGFASWKNRVDLADHEALARINLKEVDAQNKLEQLKSLFRQLNGPVRLNDLLTVVMRLEGISPHEDKTSPVEDLPDVRPGINIEQKLHQRELLAALWTEIQELSTKQRTALLLSLRDEKGGALLQLFPAMGIATVRHISASLSMDPHQFGEIWKELPLDDFRIASLLAISRQQVINLRKCARERLSRRLAARR
jgi:hypothetical protein